jgi:hypothetical protein
MDDLIYHFLDESTFNAGPWWPWPVNEPSDALGFVGSQPQAHCLFRDGERFAYIRIPSALGEHKNAASPPGIARILAIL